MRFIVDTTLGGLAKWLRALGLDTTIFSERDLHRLIQVAQRENRTILTRNRRLEAKLFLGNIVIVKEDLPDLQAGAVLQTLGLRVDPSGFFTRCLLCNEKLEIVSRAEAETRVPEYVFHAHQVFHRCPSCQRIYWEGTHPKNMKDRIQRVLESVRKTRS